MAFRFSWFKALVFFIICLRFVQIESGSLKFACDVTLDPKFCVSTMSSLFPGSLPANSIDIGRMALRLGITEGQKVLQIISRLPRSTFKGRQLDAIEDCMQLYDLTLDDLSKSLSNVTANSMKWRQAVDIQTWLSVALTNLLKY